MTVVGIQSHKTDTENQIHKRSTTLTIQADVDIINEEEEHIQEQQETSPDIDHGSHHTSTRECAGRKRTSYSGYLTDSATDTSPHMGTKIHPPTKKQGGVRRPSRKIKRIKNKHNAELQRADPGTKVTG